MNRTDRPGPARPDRPGPARPDKPGPVRSTPDHPHPDLQIIVLKPALNCTKSKLVKAGVYYI